MAPLRTADATHPRHSRHGANPRWLLATTLLSVVSAAFLWLALHAVLTASSRVSQPERAAVLPTGRVLVSGLRTERLVGRPANPSEPSPIRTRTLQSTGLGDRPLTVLMADLGHLDDVGPDTSPVAATPSGDRPHDNAASPAPTPLPSVILSGGAVSPTLPRQASGYAAVEAPAPPPIEPGPLGTPLNVTSVPRGPAAAAEHTDLVVAQRGDTLGRALSRFGLTGADLVDLSAALLPDTKVFSGGETLELRGAAASPAARPYMVTLTRPAGGTREAALTDADRYARVEVAADATPEPEALAPAEAAGDEVSDDGDDAGSIREALDALDGHDGVDQALTASIVRVLGAGVDLGRGVAGGDKVVALYGAAADGSPGDRDVLFAGIDRGGRATRFYRYASADDGGVDYYDAGGHSVMKFLLRKPVANGTLGDGFGWRIHPVLHDRRFHEGVDYRAPYGSPIVAAGEGVVDKIGFERGYGKYIRVRHDLGYETTYAHVSGFSRSVAVGRRVQQGETIAFVGSTGYSTGPHLYYEVKINGRNVDPLTVKLAAGRFLDGADLASFDRQRDRVDTLVKASIGEDGR